MNTGIVIALSITGSLVAIAIASRFAMPRKALLNS